MPNLIQVQIFLRSRPRVEWGWESENEASANVSDLCIVAQGFGGVFDFRRGIVSRVWNDWNVGTECKEWILLTTVNVYRRGNWTCFETEGTKGTMHTSDNLSKTVTNPQPERFSRRAKHKLRWHPIKFSGMEWGTSCHDYLLGVWGGKVAATDDDERTGEENKWAGWEWILNERRRTLKTRARTIGRSLYYPCFYVFPKLWGLGGRPFYLFYLNSSQTISIFPPWKLII